MESTKERYYLGFIYVLFENVQIHNYDLLINFTFFRLSLELHVSMVTELLRNHARTLPWFPSNHRQTV
jgi:hypothetical protein